MKKLIMSAVAVFFLTIPAIYAQEIKIIKLPQGVQQYSFSSDLNTLRLRMGVDGGSLLMYLEGKLNGKAIEFKTNGMTSIIMNDGKMSDEENRLVESAIDIMKSALKRDKFEMPGMSFTLKGEENTLQVNVKSGGAVFEGKLEGTIKGKPFEFKSDAEGGVVVNNGELSDNEITAFISGLTIFTQRMRRTE